MAKKKKQRKHQGPDSRTSAAKTRALNTEPAATNARITNQSLAAKRLNTPLPQRLRRMPLIAIYPLLLLVTAIALYLPTIDFGTVWDDMVVHMWYKKTNPPVTLGRIADLWGESHQGLYIPLTYSFWMLVKGLNEALGWHATDPALFHALNVLLHAINAVLVYRVLLAVVRLQQMRFACFFGALLFALHPLQVESVAWIAEMRDLLAFLCGALSILLFLRWEERLRAQAPLFNQIGFWLASLLMASLAMTAKPSAAALGPMLFCLLWFARGHGLFRSLLLSAPWFAVGAGILAATFALQTAPEVLEFFHAPFWVRPFIWMHAILFYLQKLFFPLTLHATYGHSPFWLMHQWTLYVLWVLPVTLIALSLWKKRQFPLPALALALFIAGFLPVSGLGAYAYQDWSAVADRYLYWSMLGPALAFALLVQFLRGLFARRLANRRLAAFGGALVACLILAPYGVRSWIRLPDWQEQEHLWTRTVEDGSLDFHAPVVLVDKFQREKRFEEAIEAMTRAIELSPWISTGSDDWKSNHASMITQRANLLYSLGQKKKQQDKDPEPTWREALEDFNRALELAPASAEIYINRGNIHNNLGNHSRALSDYDKALTLPLSRKYRILTHRNRASIFWFLGQGDQTLQAMRILVKLEPSNIDFWLRLARLLAHEKHYSEAAQAARRILALKPKHKKAQELLDALNPRKPSEPES